MPKRRHSGVEKPSANDAAGILSAIIVCMLEVAPEVAWAKRTEEINENDTTAACTGPYHFRPTYIMQTSPLHLDPQVGLVVRDGVVCVKKPVEYPLKNQLRFLCMLGGHPYINSLVDVTHDDEFRYNLILEYHPHGDLDHYLRLQKKRCFNIHGTIMLAWVKQLLEAIAYMHEKDVVHADIKMDNIFVVEPSRLCIGDLGSAQSADVNGVGTWRGGTEYWHAPENAHKYARASKKSDMWTLGCVVYGTMTFTFIYDLDESYEELVNRNQHVHDLHAFGSATLNTPQIYSFALCNVVYTCLERDQRKRPSAQELLATL
jgi:serine/threonine protein kinase